MRLLLDESLPRPLASKIHDFEVATVHGIGWAGLKNGELLARTQREGFDAFLTADQNLPHQQNLRLSDLRIIVLAGLSNRLGDLEPLLPPAIAALAEMGPGEGRVIRERES